MLPLPANFPIGASYRTSAASPTSDRRSQRSDRQRKIQIFTNSERSEGSRARQRVSGRCRYCRSDRQFSSAAPAFAQNEPRGCPPLHSDKLLKRRSIVREKRARCQARSAPPTAPFPPAAQPAVHIASTAASSARSAGAGRARQRSAASILRAGLSPAPRALLSRSREKMRCADFRVFSLRVQGSPLPRCEPTVGSASSRLGKLESRRQTY